MKDIERLIVENISWLKRKAHRYYVDDFDADDLTGETIEKILQNHDKYDVGKNFRPWALTIMHNTFITQYNRRKCITFSPLEDYQAISHYYSDQLAAISNICSTIRKCAAKSIAIECVVLYAKGYSYDEIARMLSIPIGTVMSRISNGRQMLRRALGYNRT